MIGHSAVPAYKPQLNHPQPRTSRGRASKLTRDDISRLPNDALVALDGANQAVRALYDVDFESVADVVNAYRKRIEQ